MEIKDIENYARQLFDQSGPKAIAIAAQRAAGHEEAGQSQDAETWRKIEASLLARRGAHQG